MVLLIGASYLCIEKLPQISCRMPPWLIFCDKCCPSSHTAAMPSPLTSDVPGGSEIAESVSLLMRLLFLSDVSEFNYNGKGICWSFECYATNSRRSRMLITSQSSAALSPPPHFDALQLPSQQAKAAPWLHNHPINKGSCLWDSQGALEVRRFKLFCMQWQSCSPCQGAGRGASSSRSIPKQLNY